MKPSGISSGCLTLLLSFVLLGSQPPQAGAAPKDEATKRALALTKEGRYAEAVAEYEAMLKTAPMSKPILERLGPLLFLTGENQRAKLLFRRVTRSLPRYARGHYFYAYALRRLGEHREALAAYAAHQRLEPTSVHALYGMAACHLALGQDAEALKTYQAFIAQAAQAPEKDGLGGWILRAREEAKALRKKLDLAKTNAAVREVLAAADRATREGNLLEAEKLLKEGHAKLGAPVPLGVALASLLVRVRRFGEALPLLQELLKKDPKHLEGRYLLALALRFEGKLKEAAAAYRKVIQTREDHPDAHYGLAETLRKLGDLQEALKLYERYIVIEKRPTEQQYVTKAREQAEALKAQLAAGSPGPDSPGPGQPAPGQPAPGQPAPGQPAAGQPSTGDSELDLDTITDPRIRAILEARRRLNQRRQGLKVSGASGATASPDRPDPAATAAERRRQRAEAAQKRREEARQRALEIKRQRAEAAQKRQEEQARRREEARQKALEIKRQRAEAAQKRQEEQARRREEAKQRAARAQAQREAKRMLARGPEAVTPSAVTPEIREILTGWARAATSSGDHSRALAAWKILAQAEPSDSGVRESLAIAATTAGDHRAAVEAYRALVRAEPKRRELYPRLRAAEAKAGLPLTPLPLELVLPAEVQEGRRLLAAGRAAEARALAEKRLGAQPDDGLTAVLLADALFAMRRFAEARAAAERAAQAHPKLAGPHRLLGAEHLRLRNRSAARASYQRFLKALGSDPSEETNRALVTAIVKRLR